METDQFKEAVAILLAVLFLTSVTATAVNASGNELQSDKGTGQKIVSVSRCSNGGTVSMKRNGGFTYRKPVIIA